jgi:hypothetical protein
LCRRALLDRQAAPGRVDPEEGVRDVLAVHDLNRYPPAYGMASEQVESQLKRSPRRSPASTSSATRDSTSSTSARRSRCARACARTSRRARATRGTASGRWRSRREIETIVTGTEVEALHLEQNLVKRHRPPFNVRLRDDKSFPYIAVTVEDDYPRVMFTRERHRRGRRLLRAVREREEGARDARRPEPRVPLPALRGAAAGRHSGIPCLDFHIERCHAPCVGYISKEDYRELIDQVIEFLSGDDRRSAPSSRSRCGRGGRGAVRGCRALPQPAAAIERLSERQAVERRRSGRST